MNKQETLLSHSVTQEIPEALGALCREMGEMYFKNT